MRCLKVISILFFCLTIVTPFIGFCIATDIGELEIFGSVGLVRYSFFFYLGLPFAILSIVIGIILKNKRQKYKKNFIVAFICIPITLLFGSYRFIFNNISYDSNQMYMIEEKTQLNLPNNVKIATEPYDEYNISHVKILDLDEEKEFQHSIESSEYWCKQLNVNLNNLLSWTIQYDILSSDFYMFYNLTTNEYNVIPEKGEYKCVLISYTVDYHKLIIIDDLLINIE